MNMNITQLKKYIDLVSPLPTELKSLIISYSMHTFDVLKHNRQFIEYLKLNNDFKLEVYPDDDAGSFNIQSIYSNDDGDGDGKSFLVKDLDNYMTLFKNFQIENMVVSQAYSNDQWRQLIPWAKRITVRQYNPEKLKTWEIPLDKIQTITCFELSLLSCIIDQLPLLKNIKRVKVFVLEPLLSDDIDNIIILCESVKCVVLEHPAIHLGFFTSDSISRLSKFSNIELEIPHFMPPYTNVSFLNGFRNCSTGTYLLNSIDELSDIEKFKRIETLVFREIEELKDLKFIVQNVRELKLIDTELIQNCDFSGLKGLKEVTLDARIDPKSLSTLPSSINILYLSLDLPGNNQTDLYRLPNGTRDLTVDGIRTFRQMDLTPCCCLDSIFLCGSARESVAGINESDNVWNTISESVGKISISIAPTKALTSGKIFGMKVSTARDADTPLFLEISSSHEMLVVVNVENDNDEGLDGAIEKLAMPYCVVNGIGRHVTVSSPTDNVRLLYELDSSESIKTQNGIMLPFTPLSGKSIPGFKLLTSSIAEYLNKRKFEEVDDDSVDETVSKIRRKVEEVD